jgi:hypothetical protein
LAAAEIRAAVADWEAVAVLRDAVQIEDTALAGVAKKGGAAERNLNKPRIAAVALLPLLVSNLYPYRVPYMPVPRVGVHQRRVTEVVVQSSLQIKSGGKSSESSTTVPEDGEGKSAADVMTEASRDFRKRH